MFSPRSRLLRYLTLPPLAVGAAFLAVSLALPGSTDEASRAVEVLVFVTALSVGYGLFFGLVIGQAEHLGPREAAQLKGPMTIVALVLTPGAEACLAVIVVLAIHFRDSANTHPSVISAIAFGMLFLAGGVNLLMYRRSQRRDPRSDVNRLQ